MTDAAPTPSRSPQSRAASGTAAPSALRGAAATLRRTFWGVGAFSLVINALMLTGPLYMLQVYDSVLTSHSVPTLVALTLLVVVLYATLGLLGALRAGVLAVAGSRFEDALSSPALSASLSRTLGAPGRPSDRPARDLRSLRRFFTSPAITTVFDAPMAPLFFLVLFLLHWAYGLWALFGAAALVGIGLVRQRRSSQLFKEAEEAEREANSRMGEMMRSAETVSAMGMERELGARWRDRFDRSDIALTRATRHLAAFNEGGKAFRLFLQSAILGLGAWLSIEGLSTPGAMIAASILMGRAIAPVEQAVGQWRTIVLAREAWGSLGAALEDAPVSAPATTLPPITGALSVKDVSAAAPGLSRPVIQDVGFELVSGDALGIVGASASGKTTLLRVIAGLWPALEGEVRLDGAALSQYGRAELGRQIGYMPQQVELLAGSVRDNIARFDPEAPDAAVIAAARAAGCHELILQLDGGYDAEIGEGGAHLSAGQRQRVGLARALYGSPRLILLDEPAANLDGEGETALLGAVREASRGGATVILVAHRRKTLSACNKLLVLANGGVRAFGPAGDVAARLGRPQPAEGGVTVIKGGAAGRKG